ncbi:hypothetical protein V2G26_018088 [Clonostachys chloroleuca]
MAGHNLLADKVALVTGAASGFGEGIATLFAAEGAKVLVADINEEGGNRVTKAIIASGGSATFIRLDVTSVDAWHKALASAKEIYGRLDVLVNNAGWTYTVQDSHNVTEQLYDRLFDINVKSIFHSVRVIVPYFLERGGGDIINIGSCITERPTTKLTWYGASKGAVDMITRHLSNEYAGRNIRINGVSPSISETPLMREFIGKTPDEESKNALISIVPLQRLCTPLDIAKGALYFASPYFHNYQTGIILRVDGGLYT